MSRPVLDELLGAVRTELRLQLALEVLPVGCDARRQTAIQYRAAISVRGDLQAAMQAALDGAEACS